MLRLRVKRSQVLPLHLVKRTLKFHLRCHPASPSFRPTLAESCILAGDSRHVPRPAIGFYTFLCASSFLSVFTFLVLQFQS